MADADVHLDSEPDDADAVWPPPGETPDARAARLARERVMLEEAEEDIRHGRVVSGPELTAWLRKWSAGERLPEDDVIDLEP